MTVDYRLRALYYMHLKNNYTAKLIANDKKAHDYLLDITFRVLDDIGGTSAGNLIHVDGKEISNIIVKDLTYDRNTY